MHTSRKILADDDKYVRRIYGGLLRREGIVFDEADSHEAMSLLLFRFSYDAILLDLSLWPSKYRGRTWDF